MLEEEPGVISSARVILLLTFLCTIPGPLFFAGIASWKHGSPVDLPPNIVAFCQWAFTSACALKTVSKFAESKTT